MGVIWTFFEDVQINTCSKCNVCTGKHQAMLNLVDPVWVEIRRELM